MRLKTVLCGLLVSFMLPIYLRHADGSIVRPKLEMVQTTSSDLKPLETAQKKPIICDPFYDLLKQYDWDVPVMAAIMKAESGCNVSALGDTALSYQQGGRTYGYSVGLLQVRILPGREHCETDDLKTYMDCAYKIYKGQGYSAWSVFSNSSYLKYL